MLIRNLRVDRNKLDPGVASMILGGNFSKGG